MTKKKTTKQVKQTEEAQLESKVRPGFYVGKRQGENTFNMIEVFSVENGGLWWKYVKANNSICQPLNEKRFSCLHRIVVSSLANSISLPPQ